MGFHNTSGAGLESWKDEKKNLYIKMLEYIAMPNPLNGNKPNIWGYDMSNTKWKDEELIILGTDSPSSPIKIQVNKILLMNLEKELGGYVIFEYKNRSIKRLRQSFDGFARVENFTFSQKFVDWFTEK